MSEEYTGHVDPGGPTARRVVEGGGARVEIRKLSVGGLDNNAYVLRDTDSVQALLVDAADEADRLLAELHGLELVGIVTTHGHRDHWQALDEVADATGAPVYLHPGDQRLVPRPADRELRDGLRIGFGAAGVTAVHTPGHTPGSTCLLLGRHHLFTGDTLFPGGPGRVTNPVEFEQIMQSLEQRLFTLPDDTWVYPGHGDDTTLGAERPSIPEWRARGW
ncbi:MAG TPA: MBL fold metallo-hydrolase [Egibacteraceae bacterium]|nr:MBL fold metallo-hydrolase [Egibacteraceae bacterium]